MALGYAIEEAPHCLSCSLLSDNDLIKASTDDERNNTNLTFKGSYKVDIHVNFDR